MATFLLIISTISFVCISLASASASQLQSTTFNIWVDTPSSSSSLSFREFHVAAPINGDLLIFGGSSLDLDVALNDTWIYSFQSEAWTEIVPDIDNNVTQPYPAHRLAAAFTSINDTHIFMFGGLSGLTSDEVLSDMWIFDGTASVNEWIPVTAGNYPLLARWGATASYYNNAIFMFGGFTTYNTTPGAWAPCNEVWMFDLDLLTWTIIATSNAPAPRGIPCSLVIGSSLYLVSGCAEVELDHFVGQCSVPFNDVWILSLDSRQWNRVAASGSTPIGVSWVSALNSTAFIVYYQVAFHSQVQIFDIATATWSLAPVIEESEVPSGRLGASFTQTSAGYFLFGGTNARNFNEDSWLYIPESAAWFSTASISQTPDARDWQSTNTYRDTVVIFGGITGAASNELWFYNTSKLIWSLATPQSMWPAARCGHASVIVNETLYVFGGFDFVQVFGDCWAYDLQKEFWSNLNCESMNIRPAARAGHGMAIISLDEALMFGGDDFNLTIFNDTWVWNLAQGTWTQVECSSSNECPSAREYFSMSLMKNQQVVMYGGINFITSQVFSEVWAFSVSLLQWRMLKIHPQSVPVEARSLHAAAVYACQKLVITGGRIGENQNFNIASNETFYGMFVDSNTWIWYMVENQGLYARFGHSAAFPGQMEEYCVNSDSYFTPISVQLFVLLGAHDVVLLDGTDLIQSSYVACNAGTGATSFSEPCVACAVGYFSSAASNDECQACTLGTTSFLPGSVSEAYCDLCTTGWCSERGECKVINGQPRCECTFAYSGRQCEQRSLEMSLVIYGCIGAMWLALLAWLIKLYWNRAKLRQREQLSSITVSYHSKLLAQEQEFDSAWEIKHEHIKVGDLIGSGAYGVIRRGKWGDHTVAIKALNEKWAYNVGKYQRYGSGTVLAHSDFAEEIKTLRKMKHPNVVFCYGAGHMPEGFLFMVMEFCARGSLDTILKDPLQQMQWQLRNKLALDLARGMQFLHAQSCVHCDVKSLNVLVTRQWTAKISDFGTFKLLRRDDSAVQSHLGTLWWTAPEVLSGKPNTFKSDVYSVGIVLWEICARKRPFEGVDDVIGAVVSGQRPKASYLRACSAVFRDLVQACWSADEHMRPCMDEVVQSLKLTMERPEELITEIYVDASVLNPVDHCEQMVTEQRQYTNIDVQSGVSKVQKAPNSDEVSGSTPTIANDRDASARVTIVPEAIVDAIIMEMEAADEERQQVIDAMLVRMAEKISTGLRNRRSRMFLERQRSNEADADTRSEDGEECGNDVQMRHINHDSRKIMSASPSLLRKIQDRYLKGDVFQRRSSRETNVDRAPPIIPDIHVHAPAFITPRTHVSRISSEQPKEQHIDVHVPSKDDETTPLLRASESEA